MSNKLSFVVYHEWFEMTERLSDKEIAKLYRAIFNYNIDGVIDETLDGETKMAFFIMRKTFERDKVKYLKRCEKNKQNIDKRWENKKDEEELY